MASEILAAGVGEIRTLSTANGGTSLTTTAAFIGIPLKTSHLYITPRNLVTDPVAKFSLNPYLAVLKSLDAMATKPTDYSTNAQDCSASSVVVLSNMSTLAGGDFLLIGAELPFRGVYVTMTASVNDGDASALSVHYWKSDGTWTDTSATDGTTSGGKTFAQSGLVYWTVPGTWAPVELDSIYTGARLEDGSGTFTGSTVYLTPGANTVTCTAAGTCTITLPTGATGMVRGSGSGGGTMTVTSEPVALAAGANTVTTSGAIGTIVVTVNPPTPSYALSHEKLFWTRWTVSASMGTAVTASAMHAANRSTAYGELLAGQPFEQTIKTGMGGYGCVEAVMAAGTGNLIVMGAARRGGGF
jgi:nucleotide-binding universal stress UspA family protein